MMKKKFLPIFLILLLALVLRLAMLTEIPPGLTHDEANHGREALEILNGVFRFYFPLNYGSEPLYSYTAAGMMLLFGKSLFSLRLVNVVFGMLAIGATYLPASRLFDRQTALLTAVLLSVSFWPLATSRQALRAGMLPFFMAVAVWFFWQMVKPASEKEQRTLPWGSVIGFGVSVAITLHIYLAARVAWLIFPLFLVYLAIVHRAAFRKAWLPVGLGLGLAGVLIVPMVSFLRQNPQVQPRVTMLDGPLQQLASGNLRPIWDNATEALLAFVWPGFGDSFLAYNIPGRPVFDGLTAVFFVVGVVAVVRQWKRPSSMLLLLWFFVGIAPSLITGATANTTRNLAALPATYMLPALGFISLVGFLQQRLSVLTGQRIWQGAAAVWLLLAAGVTVNDYFRRWGTAVDVRDAYQHTLTAEVEYLQENHVESAVVMSTVYPGPAHDPSINLVMFGGQPPETRWTDARTALIIPDQPNADIIIPASTPLHRAFEPLLTPIESVSLRPDDLNPGFTHWRFEPLSNTTWHDAPPLANFDDALTLTFAGWIASEHRPGDVAELLTVWQVLDPTRVGPIVPPSYTTDVTLFTHVLAADGEMIVQRDALDAPSWSWQAGDTVLQIHQFPLPSDIAGGSYRTIVGMYDKLSGERRPVLAADGTVIDSFVEVSPLRLK